jgi:ABC-type Fe3+-siderophore transport system permease subunit
MPPLHFAVFVAVSLAVFVALLAGVLRRRAARPPLRTIGAVSFVVVVVGMVFAKVGANAGLPVAVYYGVPALTTLLLPPLAFRMRAGEATGYLVLAFTSSPAIHVAFSLLLGWNEYLPFWPIAPLWAAAR